MDESSNDDSGNMVASNSTQQSLAQSKKLFCRRLNRQQHFDATKKGTKFIKLINRLMFLCYLNQGFIPTFSQPVC